MKELIVPKKLKEGDTVCFISLSGGRAGDDDMIFRYELAKERFEREFKVKVVEAPHALCGSMYLYQNPEVRWFDLKWALENPEIKGIICNMGGDDSYRVIKYVHPDVLYNVIHDNPKVFMGYSDIASWINVFTYYGVRSYYGPNVLTPIGQIGELDSYTKEAIRKTLFSDRVIGNINPAEKTTPIEWNSSLTKDDIVWTKNDGYKVLQGEGKVRGQIMTMIPGPANQMLASRYSFKDSFYDNTILFIEHCNSYDSPLSGLHNLRALAVTGAFDYCKAIVTGKLDEASRKTLLKVINEEVNRKDLILLENVDFVHHTPMTVLPIGAECEIDTDKKTLAILESGVL
ncbi:MAG: LD-carboxypeptidase [Clostridia bacterium]|nr:LD-carboxypeptidase [Clostridia bacterium]